MIEREGKSCEFLLMWFEAGHIIRAEVSAMQAFFRWFSAPTQGDWRQGCGPQIFLTRYAFPQCLWFDSRPFPRDVQERATWAAWACGGGPGRSMRRGRRAIQGLDMDERQQHAGLHHGCRWGYVLPAAGLLRRARRYDRGQCSFRPVECGPLDRQQRQSLALRGAELRSCAAR